MLTKEKEAMVRAARNLRGAMLIESVKCWRRGEIDDAGLEQAAKDAVKGVKDVAASLEPRASSSPQTTVNPQVTDAAKDKPR